MHFPAPLFAQVNNIWSNVIWKTIKEDCTISIGGCLLEMDATEPIQLSFYLLSSLTLQRFQKKQEDDENEIIQIYAANRE